MASVYWREQRHVCGERYMEVDLYAVTAGQHRATRRAKKREASRLAQQRYNDNRAVRYRVQLVNANFGRNDFHWTATYDDDHLPEATDRRRVDLDWSAFVKRLYRWCRANGIRRPLWAMGTEYSTVQPDGSVLGRHHHHAFIQRVPGLTREVLEDLWRDAAGQPIGMCRCDRLEPEHGSLEALVKYICKNARCDRTWRQSRGLAKPVTPAPNDSRWSRRKLEEASTRRIDDAAFWGQQYRGWKLRRVETKVSDAGYRHTLVILYRDDGRGAPVDQLT